MDLFSRDETRPIFLWLNEVRPQKSQLFASVISLGQIAQAIENMDPPGRNQWRRLYQEGRRSLEETGGIIDVDVSIVDAWHANLRGSLLDDISDSDDELGEDDRLILATAIARGYALVCVGSSVFTTISQRTPLAIVEL